VGDIIKEEDGFEYKKELVYKAIEDTTNTIRFLDTKIAAVFVFMGLIFAFIASIGGNIYSAIINLKHLNVIYDGTLVILALYILLTLISVIYGFLAVNAIDNPTDHVKTNSKEGKDIPAVWYLCTNKELNCKTKRTTDMVTTSIEDYTQKIKTITQNQLIETISLEHLKVSYIREMKLKRTNKSIEFFMTSLIPLSVIMSYVVYYYFFVKA
jgi:hypothetical protein